MPLKMTRRAWIRTAIYSGLVVTGGSGYVSSKRIEKIHAEVPLKGLPRRLDGFKIAVMSDFHAGAFTTDADIDEAIRLVNNEKPDLISLLGDYVDGAYSHSPKNVKKGSYLFKALKRLDAPFGIFAVLGNHDHWTDANKVRNELLAVPITILDNVSVRLNNGLSVAGVDDFWEGPSYPIRAIRALNPDDVVIMLSHNPDVNLQLRGDKRVRLILSGHTHGGQLRIPFFKKAPWVPCSKKYKGPSGLIKESDLRWTFISKGVGSFFVPVRLACPPDVGILTLTAL